MPDRPRHVLLVHGAWHGAWCWARLQAELDRRGVASYAIDLPGHGASSAPLGGLHDDARAVEASLAALGAVARGGIVLVGHSYGGAPVTEAAARAPEGTVAHLVYVAAFALDDGESVADFIRHAPAADVALARAVVRHEDATTTVDPTVAPVALYGSTPSELVTAAVARLSPQTLASMQQRIEGSPRERIASTYVRCTRDETVHPDHQRLLAARCGDVVELDTDHSPFLSATSALADVIERLAKVPS